MSKSLPQQLSRRERQIMDAIFARGRASVAEVLGALEDPPSYSSVRALLRILVEKGHLTYKEMDGRYIYMPTQSRTRAARAALRQVLQTFYEGSAVKTVAALLDLSSDDMSQEDLNRLSKLIEEARKEGR
ncbi:MAG: BlaI/MecI/CopY family transcriptional regulator [Candidatus Hydrogenedentales bacterium]